jgi:hypothetical protein
VAREEEVAAGAAAVRARAARPAAEAATAGQGSRAPTAVDVMG